MTQLKIRASKAGCLMTDPRSKADKEAGNLSETAKTYIRELWIEKNFNRRKDLTNKYVEKGLLNEELSIDAISMLDNEMYIKNENLYTNDYLTGTPDVLTEDTVIDLKTSYDIFTFAKAELTDLYEMQLMCYMELTGKRKAKLIYCLTDAPDATIDREVKQAVWKLQDETIADDLRAKLIKDMRYDDIPLSMKVKTFEVTYDEARIEQLYKRIEKAREFYNSIQL